MVKASYSRVVFPAHAFLPRSHARATFRMNSKVVLRFVLAFAMMFVGVSHFTNPEPFVRIVPKALPSPDHS